MKRSAAIIIVVALAGCASVETSSGNLRPFLSQALSDHGATLPPVSAIPNIQAEWEYRPDANGFVLDVAGDSFAKIDQFLRGYFGAPQIWTEANLDGHPHGVFGPKQTGGIAVQYVRTDSGTQVICVKKQKAQQP